MHFCDAVVFAAIGIFLVHLPTIQGTEHSGSRKDVDSDLTDDEDVTEFDDKSRNSRFPCTEDRFPSISLEKVCDKVDDCSDGRDEAHCSHFYCKDGGNIKYLNQNQVCDGIQNCAGGSDECQPGCIESAFSDEQCMLKDKVFMIFVWLFSGVALIGCGSLALATTQELINYKTLSQRQTRSRINAKINKVLILSLSISNLLVAVYAFIICVKSVEFEGRYCLVDQEWRSSVSCSVLGAMFVIGSEQSVLTMMIITVRRIYSIWRPTTIQNVKNAWIGVSVTWMLSVALGFIPMLPIAEGYFVGSVTLTERNKFKRNGLFEDPNDTAADKYGYYSSHALCLPTFTTDRKTDASWGYSFCLLLINFTAFTFMLIACIVTSRNPNKSSNAVAAISKASKQKRKDTPNRQMQRKLTLIVATDCFYWMPVCIMGFLQLGGVNILEYTYLPTGLLIIPINSALNPFLYSNLPEFLWKKSKALWNAIRSIFPFHEIFNMMSLRNPENSGNSMKEKRDDAAYEDIRVTKV